MPDDDVISVITRGFAGMQEQFRERDKATAMLSEKMVGVEFKLDQLKEATAKIEADMSRAETERIKIRVENLETATKEFKTKQDSNAAWIRGLLVSVVLLLLGVIFNYVRTK